MFTATLFITAEVWKCPSTDEWIKNMWYIYNGIPLRRKKNDILPFPTTWMDLEDITLSEITQRKTNSI